MKKALVETRLDPRCKPTLDGLAAALGKLGYDVVRWRNDTRPLDADLFVLWNGTHPIYGPMLARMRGRPALFAELGWLPQDGVFQLDTDGINSEASWVKAKPQYTPIGKLQRRDGDLLVVLQDERDMQIRRADLSPFSEMLPWLKLLKDGSALPLRVRFHPRSNANPNVAMWLAANPEVSVDGRKTLRDAMRDCAAVATINSTCGLEAIDAGIPVLCFGKALYRVPHVCFPIREPGEIAERTEQIRRGDIALCPEAMTRFIVLVKSKQWTLAGLPERLEKLLQGE